MSLAGVVSDLRARGITLRAEGDELVAAPVHLLTAYDRRLIRTHKSDLLALLVEAEGTCWRCQASRRPPSLDDQVSALKTEHANRPPVFWWTETEWLKLRSLLQEGNVLAIVASFFRIASPYYDGALVLRSDQQMVIPRKALK
jgi:hypothetical protein